jgi:hypothetical protein
LALELAGQESVVFLAKSTKRLDEDDEQNNPDTGGGEHAIVFDLPSRR